jgi:beta-galactosidase/beta-glucuronidase
MRKVFKIKEGWNFTDQHKKRMPVTIPHTWNNQDGQDGGNDYWRGTSVYDVTFDAPVYLPEEVVYLQFHGVNASAKVILNGEVVCQHEGGYSTFRADVTKYLAAQNELVVEVDNSVNDRVYPQKEAFTF